MKKIAILILTILPIGLLWVISATGKIIINTAVVKAESIEIINNEITILDETKTITIDFEEELQIEVEIKPAKATQRDLVFTTNNPNIISIDENGKIKGIDYGIAIVYVSLFDNPLLNDKVEIEVSNLKVYSVNFQEEELNLMRNDTWRLIPVIKPLTALNKNVHFNSSDSSVASVDENGIVTANKRGNATITVTTEDQNKTATIKVNVVAATEDGYFDYAHYITQNSRFQLSYSIDAGKEPIFTSSDLTTAEVDENGLVEFKKNGTVTIRVTLNDNSYDEVVLDKVSDTVTSFKFIDRETNVTSNEKNFTIDLGNENESPDRSIYYTLTPYDSVQKPTITYKKGNNSIVSVIIPENPNYKWIELKGLTNGEVILEVKMGNVVNTVNIKVLNPPRSIFWRDSIEQRAEKGITIAANSPITFDFTITGSDQSFIHKFYSTQNPTVADSQIATTNGKLITFQKTGSFFVEVVSNSGSVKVVKSNKVLVHVNNGVNVYTLADINNVLMEKTIYSEKTTLNLLNNIYLQQSDFILVPKYFEINNKNTFALSGDDYTYMGSAILVITTLDFYGNGYEINARNVNYLNDPENVDAAGKFFSDNRHRRAIISITGSNIDVNFYDLSIYGNNAQEEAIDKSDPRWNVDPVHSGPDPSNSSKEILVTNEFLQAVRIMDSRYSKSFHLFNKNGNMAEAIDDAHNIPVLYFPGQFYRAIPSTMIASTNFYNFSMRECALGIEAYNVNSIVIADSFTSNLNRTGLSFKQVANIVIHNYTSGYSNGIPIELVESDSIICGPTRDENGRGVPQKLTFTGFYKTANWVSGKESSFGSNSTLVVMLIDVVIRARIPGVIDKGLFNLDAEGKRIPMSETNSGARHIITPYFMASQAGKYLQGQIIGEDENGQPTIKAVKLSDEGNKSEVKMGNYENIVINLSEPPISTITKMNSFLRLDKLDAGFLLQGVPGVLYIDFAIISVDQLAFSTNKNNPKDDIAFPYITIDCDK